MATAWNGTVTKTTAPTPQQKHVAPEHTHRWKFTGKYRADVRCEECDATREIWQGARIEQLEQQIAAMTETMRYIVMQPQYKGLARAQEAAIVWLPEDERIKFDRMHRGE